jgi:hypothetical protein
MLPQTLVKAGSGFATKSFTVLQALHKLASSSVATGGGPWEFNLQTEKAMPSALEI